MPKPIVHGHGGVLLAAAAGGKNMDLAPSYEQNSFGERYHWYSTCGWIMWNAQVNGLLSGATICLYDGSPSGPKEAPDFGTLFRFAARHRVTYLGAGAAFYEGCVKSGLDLSSQGDLSALRALGTTGSPLSEAAQLWGVAEFKRIYDRPIWWMNMSGGTDLAANFVGANRELPQVPGRMQCRQLGSATESVGRERPFVDRRGRRPRLHEAPAVDATLLLGGRGQHALSRQLFPRVPRRLAPWRLDQHR